MRDLNTLINTLKENIEATCVYTRFGSLCENKTDKSIPYGLGLIGDCQGKIYSYNDKETCEGYMFIKRIYTDRTFSTIPREFIELGIYVFVSTKTCQQDILGSYQRAGHLLNELRKIYGFSNVDMETPEYPNKNFQEVVLITLRTKLPQDCSLSFCNPVPVAEVWDWEGVLTSGEPLLYYGQTYSGYFFDISGNQRGSLSKDYLGSTIYYTQGDTTGTLFISGEIEKIKIGETEYTPIEIVKQFGERLSKFNMYPSPFPAQGQTINIKIKLV